MKTERIMAIDPGNRESAYAIVAVDDYRPIEIGKVGNQDLLEILCTRIQDGRAQELAIEMVSSYGMPVGRDVFETCVWIGRFQQLAITAAPGDLPVRLVYRRDVKRHICGTPSAKDSNVRQALADRFAPDAQNYGKGTKKQPGWFYSFRADIWQAYALAVAYIDLDMVVNW